MKPIRNIKSDSRLVKPGDIFIAIKGSGFDGHNFIDQAIERGAKTIIVDSKYKVKSDKRVNFVIVKNTRSALAHLLGENFKQPKNIVAVTGTNGKTSVVNFFKQIIKLLGEDAAAIGTLGFSDSKGIFADREDLKNLTTPDVITLHKTMEELRLSEIDNVAIEASSHGIDQYRLDGLHLKSAAFTNFSQDHLDYHKTMENYFKAKSELFSRILHNKSTVVLNADIEEFQSLKSICENKEHKIIDYGLNAKEIKIREIYYEGGVCCRYIINGQCFTLKTKLIGDFQIYNIFAAVGLAHSLGHGYSDIASVLDKLEPIRGRMARVGNSEVFVDYAHTPDALKKALIEMRKGLNGKLFVVFGCGGDRDVTKRPLMGDVAEKYSDFAIITDDNPRTENPSKIRADIKNAMKNYEEVDGRGEAIKKALNMITSQDRVLIAGKGHENYQIIGTKKEYFDDVKVAEKYLCSIS